LKRIIDVIIEYITLHFNYHNIVSSDVNLTKLLYFFALQLSCHC